MKLALAVLTLCMTSAIALADPTTSKLGGVVFEFPKDWKLETVGVGGSDLEMWAGTSADEATVAMVIAQASKDPVALADVLDKLINKGGNQGTLGKPSQVTLNGMKAVLRTGTFKADDEHGTLEVYTFAPSPSGHGLIVMVGVGHGHANAVAKKFLTTVKPAK